MWTTFRRRRAGGDCDGACHGAERGLCGDGRAGQAAPPPPRVEHQTPLVGLSDSITVEEVRRRLSKLERRKATGPERIAAAELRRRSTIWRRGFCSLCCLPLLCVPWFSRSRFRVDVTARRTVSAFSCSVAVPTCCARFLVLRFPWLFPCYLLLRSLYAAPPRSGRALGGVHPFFVLVLRVPSVPPRPFSFSLFSSFPFTGRVAWTVWLGGPQAPRVDFLEGGPRTPVWADVLVAHAPRAVRLCTTSCTTRSRVVCCVVSALVPSSLRSQPYRGSCLLTWLACRLSGWGRGCRLPSPPRTCVASPQLLGSRPW